MGNKQSEMVDSYSITNPIWRAFVSSESKRETQYRKIIQASHETLMAPVRNLLNEVNTFFRANSAHLLL